MTSAAPAALALTKAALNVSLDADRHSAFSLEAASQAAAFAAPEPAAQIDAIMARSGVAFRGFPKPVSAG
jgi:2-(1,2-epoxy-1,2-dihydrophenyl)acetyl-CoA isomerase